MRQNSPSSGAVKAITAPDEGEFCLNEILGNKITLLSRPISLAIGFLFYSTLLILIYTKIRLHLATVCPSGPCIELPFYKFLNGMFLFCVKNTKVRREFWTEVLFSPVPDGAGDSRDEVWGCRVYWMDPATRTNKQITKQINITIFSRPFCSWQAYYIPVTEKFWNIQLHPYYHILLIAKVQRNSFST